MQSSTLKTCVLTLKTNAGMQRASTYLCSFIRYPWYVFFCIGLHKHVVIFSFTMCCKFAFAKQKLCSFVIFSSLYNTCYSDRRFTAPLPMIYTGADAVEYIINHAEITIAFAHEKKVQEVQMFHIVI